MKNEFSTFEISRALSIKYQRLRQWKDSGYIAVSKKAKGRGERSAFSRNDVYLLALFKNLTEWGIPRGVAGSYIRDLADPRRGQPFSDATKQRLRDHAATTADLIDMNHRSAPPIDKIEMIEIRIDKHKKGPQFLMFHYRDRKGPLLSPEDSPYPGLQAWTIRVIINLKRLREETDLLLEKVK